MLHTDAGVPYNLAHLSYVSQIVQIKCFICYPSVDLFSMTLTANNKVSYFFFSKFGPSVYDASYVGFTMINTKLV